MRSRTAQSWLSDSRCDLGWRSERPGWRLKLWVNLPDDKPIDGFIPRVPTGYQVKREDMPPRVIAGEMSPKGKLRAVIRELAERGGA